MKNLSRIVGISMFAFLLSGVVISADMKQMGHYENVVLRYGSASSSDKKINNVMNYKTTGSCNTDGAAVAVYFTNENWVTLSGNSCKDNGSSCEVSNKTNSIFHHNHRSASDMYR